MPLTAGLLASDQTATGSLPGQNQLQNAYSSGQPVLIRWSEVRVLTAKFKLFERPPTFAATTNLSLPGCDRVTGSSRKSFVFTACTSLLFCFESVRSDGIALTSTSWEGEAVEFAHDIQSLRIASRLSNSRAADGATLCM